jgi:N-acetylneuraminic acid mutarotase
MGGVELFAENDGSVRRRYLRDVYRFKPGRGWRRGPDLPFALAASPSPAPVDESGIYLLGGDDGTKVGFTPPDKHPGFSPEILRYDAATSRWVTSGRLPSSRVTVPVARWHDLWIMPSGEIRPGVRTPEVRSFKVRRIKS